VHFYVPTLNGVSSRICPIYPLAMPLSILFILMFLACDPAKAQISPGPLSKAHQSLSGTTQCASCHQFGASTPTFKCLDCHKEVAQRLAAKHGYHAQIQMRNANGKECVRCHLEHNGEDFDLIHWEPSLKQFDHRLTGYNLEGKHAGVACEKCHTPSQMVPAERSLIKMKELSKSFFGLSQTCLTCHADPHRGQLSNDCQRCHTADGWKPAPLFNHATSKYPLTGAHEKVPCAKCHHTVADAKPFIKYTGLSFAKCTACHADPHKGSFTQSCESCHNTASWKQIKGLQGFDHSKTKYPLLGKHKTVACEDCHKHGDFKAQIPFAKCMDCHKDYHGGQFLKRAGGAECAGCHTVDGFKPSTFTVKDHEATKYPLEGLHAKVTCDKCHLPKAENTLFKIIQTQCKDCHEDIHKGQFKGAPYEDRCEECHDVKGFKPGHFGLARHKKTRFPLTGGHAAVLCVDCHKPVPAGSATPVKYHFEDRTCTACHQDPHKGQFREQMKAKRADGTMVGCEACHTTATWKELNRFDHSKTEFPLLGAHRAVPCADCHRPPGLETTLKNVDYREAPKQCSGCHKDVHAGQFAARKDAADCSSCHDAAKWKPAQFDHDKRTPFSLKGAHRDVGCDECHKLTREVDGKTVAFYKPTPHLCKDCHGQL
jgi:hypothetical protein